MVKLIEIVEDFMIEEERDTTNGKGIFLHHAINAVRDLHYDVSGVANSVSIPIDQSTNIAQLPTDFIREVGVAVVDFNGRLMNLTKDDRIYKTQDACGSPSSGSPSTESNNGNVIGNSFGNTQSQHLRNGENIGAWFGIRSQQMAGSYKINLEASRIEFSSSTSQSAVILKYLSDPSQINGQFYVHEYLREAIKNFIDWKMTVRKRNVGRNEKNDLHRVYVSSKTWARMRLTSFDFSEAQDIAKTNFTMSPKF
jgi:hypothetical protein|tara:strand:+ start:3519 stop:4277 length:759 start_codon:yes stop_codon:yes gene_type:complete